MAEVAKEKYSISELKEELELLITNLRIEEEAKGEKLTKEDLPKLNSNEIDVGSTESFPVEIIFNKYKFSVDENFIVTYVGEADGTIVTYTTEPVGYTNKNEVKILIKISNPKGIKTIEYPDGDKLEVTEENETEIAIDYVVNANGTYTFKILDNVGKETIKDVVIDKIDMLQPLDFTAEVQREGNTIIVVSNAQDAEADGISTKSGIDYYEYYVRNENDEEYTKYGTDKIENLATGTYKLYVIAYDKAGNSTKSEEIEVKITRKIAKVSANNHALAIDEEGNLWAWGYNDCGQVGDGTTENKYTTPVQIKTGTKFSEISAGDNYSLAIDEEGNLWAWGCNSQGQLGDGTNTYRYTPVQINEGTKFSKISAGKTHSLAIDEEGNLWAWGYNGAGQLGNGSNATCYTPKQIETETKCSQISAGWTSSIMIDINGDIWGCGYNDSNIPELGNSSTASNQKTLMQINPDVKFSKISSDYMLASSLAIDIDGNLWGWGRNTSGELGDGTETPIINAKIVNEEREFNKVNIKEGQSLAIDIEGNLWTCGYGYMGDGNYVTTQLTQVIVKEGTKFKEIAMRLH